MGDRRHQLSVCYLVPPKQICLQVGQTHERFIVAGQSVVVPGSPFTAQVSDRAGLYEQSQVGLMFQLL